MNKPLLVVITGKPASGKTTLAHLLSQEIKCPLVSRDELKEGYVNTLNTPHNELDESTAWHIYNTFFEIIHLLISKGISIIVEAAFQNKLWQPKLLELLNKADIKVIICKTTPDIAKDRFRNRLLNYPEREKFHGDDALSLLNKAGGLLTDAYEVLNINAPTLEVDTTDNYQPDIKEISSFIRE